MDTDNEGPDISLKAVYDAVKQQSKNIEAIVDAKVSEKLDSLRDEFQGTKSEVKKLKSESDYKWRFEGHKIQYNLNSDNIDELKQALWAIDNGKNQYARDLIVSTMDRIKHRNKLIKIADTSEGGWDTARQYEANPIASDSEDESKILRAENRAIRKKKNKTKKTPARIPQGNIPIPVAYTQPPAFVSSVPPPFRGGQPSWIQNFPVIQGNNAGKGQRGQCYGCGSYQHYRANCPYNNSAKTATNSKPE